MYNTAAAGLHGCGMLGQCRTALRPSPRLPRLRLGVQNCPTFFPPGLRTAVPCHASRATAAAAVAVRYPRFSITFYTSSTPSHTSHIPLNTTPHALQRSTLVLYSGKTPYLSKTVQCSCACMYHIMYALLY